MSELVTDEAVEATAQAIHSDQANRHGWSGFKWEHLKDRHREAYRADARVALEAAAPLIAARVLEEAADDIALAPALPGESAVSISNAETAAEVWLRKRAKEGRA